MRVIFIDEGLEAWLSKDVSPDNSLHLSETSLLRFLVSGFNAKGLRLPPLASYLGVSLWGEQREACNVQESGNLSAGIASTFQLSFEG